MKSYLTFFLPTAFFFELLAAPRPAVVCNYALSLPAGYQVAEFREDWLLARSESEKAQLVALCGPNQLRTSRLSEIASQGVGDLRELELAAGVRGAVFHKMHSAGKRTFPGVNAYFATRDHEYNFSIVADQGVELDLAGRRADMTALLVNSDFVQPPETTITEAEYRMRLYVAGAVAVLLFAGLAWLVLRRFLG